MKLINFQIKNYKVIDDTKPVKADPRVTALVGKNEGGKTAILKAMWKTRNVANAAFNKLYDYPRDRYSRDRKGTQAVTMLGAALGLTEATIEDLVPRDTYADAVKQVGHKFTLNNDEKSAAMNVKAMEQAFQREGLGKFGGTEKTATARVLIDAWGKDPSSVPGPTQEKARALIDAINARFDQKS